MVNMELETSCLLSAPLMCLARPPNVKGAVDASFAAERSRGGMWGVDGAWSYDFLGSFAGPSSCGESRRQWLADLSEAMAARASRRVEFPTPPKDILEETFQRLEALHDGQDAKGIQRVVRILDVGCGKGEWLANACKNFDINRFRNLQPIWRGVTGGRERPLNEGAPRLFVDCSHDLRSIEAPVLVIQNTKIEELDALPRSILPNFLGGTLRDGYDLIVSSWTWRHISDPIGTLELYANLLAVDGELHVNTFVANFEDDLEDTTVVKPSANVAQCHDEYEFANDTEAVNKQRRRFIEKIRSSLKAINAKSGGVFEISFKAFEVSTVDPGRKEGICTEGDDALSKLVRDLKAPGIHDPGTIAFVTSVSIVRRSSASVRFANVTYRPCLVSPSDALKPWDQSSNFGRPSTRAAYCCGTVP